MNSTARALLSTLAMLALTQGGWADQSFEYKILAQSGQAGIAAIKMSPNLALSFNDKGQVAFAASLAAGGEGIFVADGMRLENVTPASSASSFSTRLHMNNRGTIVTRVSGSTPGTWIYTWDGGRINGRGSIDFSGGQTGFFCSGGDKAGEACTQKGNCFELLPDGRITYWDCRRRGSIYATFLNPSINNLGQVAYLGTLVPTVINPGHIQTNVLVSTGGSGDFSQFLVAPNNVPRLMIGDNGLVIGRMGDKPNSPIRVYSSDLSSFFEIANTTKFSGLGLCPGISDSGELVAFFGNSISAGPGIFVYYVNSQEMVQVASIRTSSPEDPNIVSGFSQDVRVSINNNGVVLFQGVNAAGQSAIFRTVVRHCNNRIVALPAKQIITVGETIPTLSGTVQSLAVYDSLNNNGPGDVCLVATMSPSGIHAVVKATPKQCDVCSVCIAGQVKEANNSVDVSIGLGVSLDGSVSGSVRIYSEGPTTNLSSPAGLSFNSGGFSTITSNGALRQVRGQLLADILVDTPYRYRIQFYTNAGVYNTVTGLFPPLGSPFSTVTIENPDGAAAINRLNITRNNGQTTTYVYHPDYNGWELVTGFANALRKESLERSTNGVQRTEIRTIRNGSDIVLSRVSSLYQTFGWGEELVKTIEDSSGAARTTTYSYYTNTASDGDNYGHLRSVFYPPGRWEFYQTYDPIFGLTKSVSQFQNNPYSETTNWPSPVNRSLEVSTSGNVETRTEYLKGQPISRRWHSNVSPGYSVDAVATDPGVTNVLDASNLITATYQYLTSDTNGAKAGQTSRVINPDGTVSISAYYDEFIADPTFQGSGAAPQSETLRTVTWTGAANSNSTQVIDGVSSEEVTDLTGNLLHRYEWDIASGVLTSSETVATRDAFGRPTRSDYSDGTYTTRTYDCCGVASQTDREGITSTFNTDHTVTFDLDQNGTPETYYGTTVTRAGIATHTLTDPLGRAFKTILQGTNGALIVQDERHYNILGELDLSKDELGRTTTYTNAYVGGFTVNTTTFPDGSQSVGTSWQDGSAYETKGDAAQGLRYVSDVFQDNGVWVQTSTQTRLEMNGTPSSESTTTFTDFAGRVYKTQYPWPDGGTNVFSLSQYNSIGQLAKAIDADGVSTLYQYNARGELETTATDIANPGVIDFAGTDRVTRSRSSVKSTSIHGVPVRTSTTEMWETDNLDQPTLLQMVEASLGGATNWTTQYGLTTRTVTAIDRNNQRRTVATLNPDHTSSVNVFELGRQSSITRYDSNSVQISRATFAYDPFGRLFSETDARNGATLYSYYDDGQIHTVTTPDPDPGVTGPGYNPQTNSYSYFRDPVNGIKTVTTLPDGGKVTREFYPSGQLKKTWGARTYPEAYTYDRAGRVDTLTTWQQFDFDTGNGLAGAAVTKWHYNARGLLAFKEYADGKGPTYTYTAGGKLHTRLWARGVSTTYGYDPKSGDLLTLTYSDHTPGVTNAYDRLGRLKSVTDASGKRQLGYQYGQTTTEAYSDGMFAGITLQRGLDPLNRLQSLTVTNPAATLYQVGYGYDAASRLQTVTSGQDVAAYSYHPNADLVNTLVQTHSNQVRLTTTKLYDKLNRVASASVRMCSDSIG